MAAMMFKFWAFWTQGKPTLYRLKLRQVAKLSAGFLEGPLMESLETMPNIATYHQKQYHWGGSLVGDPSGV